MMSFHLIDTARWYKISLCFNFCFHFCMQFFPRFSFLQLFDTLMIRGIKGRIHSWWSVLSMHFCVIKVRGREIRSVIHDDRNRVGEIKQANQAEGKLFSLQYLLSYFSHPLIFFFPASHWHYHKTMLLYISYPFGMDFSRSTCLFVSSNVINHYWPSVSWLLSRPKLRKSF